MIQTDKNVKFRTSTSHNFFTYTHKTGPNIEHLMDKNLENRTKTKPRMNNVRSEDGWTEAMGEWMNPLSDENNLAVQDLA